jgi:Ca-activated chloride channel family protein
MMRERLSCALLAVICCSFLLVSCGGGGGGSSTGPSAPVCDNCINVSTPNPFGDVELTKYTGQDLLITNKGSQNLVIGQIGGGNPLASPFSIFSDDCSNKTLPPNQICRVNVRFTPTAVASGLNDSFDIPSNDPKGVTVAVSGNGIALAGPTTTPPTIGVTKDVLFGDVLMNTSSTRTLTVTNAGSLNLDIGQIASKDPLAAPFGIVSDGCSNTTLAANRECTFGVRFAPIAQASGLMDTFDIPSNDPTKPSFTVTVSGNGTAPPPTPPPPTPPPASIGVSTTNIAFGNVVWNIVSDQPVTLQNTGAAGSSNLSIRQIAQSNPLALPFSIVNDNCSQKSLAPGQTCAFVVRFAPTTQGANLSDSFDIPSSDPLKPSVPVAVSGNGRALRVSINEVNTSSCPNVTLSVTVADKDAVPVSGLEQSSSVKALSENGLSNSITSFTTALATTPVSVVLALDVSGTLTNQFLSVKSASKDFVAQLQSGDEAAVISFSQAIQLKQDFTSDVLALQAAIDNLALSGDRTILYDALFASIDNVALRTNNRAIVVISDGIDQGPPADPTNGSVKTLAEVIAHATANEVAIFTIGIGNVNADVMGNLAEATGGQYFDANTSDLATIYQIIRNIIVGKYSLTYTSAAHGSILLDVFVQDGTGRQGEVSRTFQGCP